MTCYDTDGVRGIHIGTSAKFVDFVHEDGTSVFLCLGGTNDSANYDPAETLYGGVVFSPDVSAPNIKVYLGGGGIWTEVLRKTYNIDPSHVAAFSAISQTTPGWSSKVRFDFCDGDTVIYSRSTWWGTEPEVPEEPEDVPEDICQTDIIALGAGATLYDFYYQPVQLEAGDPPTKCTIKIVDPWEDPAGHNDVFSIGETKTYGNPDDEEEIYTLTLKSIFKGDERSQVELTACYQSGIPPEIECPTPVIESITLDPEHPIVGEQVEVTINMAPGGGTFYLGWCTCGYIPSPPTMPTRSNVHKCRYYEAGTYTIECKIENTCGSLSEWKSIEITVVEAPVPPTISSLSWSPAGEYTILASGASFPGASENLRLLKVSDKATLQIGGASSFTVAEGGHFRFDNKEWWILNIVCGPECSFITLADENAEAARIPKVGDVIQFQVNIDWHGEEIGSIKWHYGKPPDKCFIAGDIDWILFASGTDMPEYMFENDEDCDIVFLRVTATNKAGEVGVFGNLCRPAFNLWKDNTDPPGLLEIQFSSGSLYQYRNLEKSVYEALKNASSKGRFFHQTIRHETIKYPYTRIR